MFNNILLPVDLDEPGTWQKTLPVVSQMAAGPSREIHVVNVVPDFGSSLVGSFFPDDYEAKALEEAKRRLAEMVDGSAEAQGMSLKMHVAHGTIYEEIIAAADKLGTDLIVMTASRPELKDYLIGPNAARVMRHAQQSVFIVRK